MNKAEEIRRRIEEKRARLKANEKEASHAHEAHSLQDEARRVLGLEHQDLAIPDRLEEIRQELTHQDEITNQKFEVYLHNIYSRDPQEKLPSVEIGIQVDCEDDEEEDLPLNIKQTKETESVKAESRDIESAGDANANPAVKFEEKRLRYLQHEDSKAIMDSERFKAFIRNRSKHVEALLFKNKNILDFMGDMDEKFDIDNIEDSQMIAPLENESENDEDDVIPKELPDYNDNRESKGRASFARRHSIVKSSIKRNSEYTKEEIEKSEAFSQVLNISEEHHTFGCLVSDFHWHYAIPQLALASYCKRDVKEDRFVENPGIVLLWNANNPKRPEYILNAKSRVPRVCFDPFNSSLVYGGLGSGAIALWDVRASRMPVKTINPVGKAHCAPIYGINFVGSKHSSNIVTVSNDGRVCLWSPNNMTEPIKKFDITFKLEQETMQSNDDMKFSVAPMIMSAPLGVSSNVYIGSLESKIYNVNLHPSEESEFVSQIFEGHNGPVCGLDFFVNLRSSNCPTNHLMLSGGFDWDIKLWYPKRTSKALMTFKHHTDYVTDVRFNPIHPIKFLSCDAAGKIAVWNLLKNKESPCYETTLPGVANTKVRWNIDGKHFAVGDTEGRITVYKQKSKALEFHDDDVKQFMGVIAQLSSNEGAGTGTA